MSHLSIMGGGGGRKGYQWKGGLKFLLRFTLWKAKTFPLAPFVGIGPLLGKTMEAYINDILVKSNS